MQVFIQPYTTLTFIQVTKSRVLENGNQNTSPATAKPFTPPSHHSPHRIAVN